MGESLGVGEMLMGVVVTEGAEDTTYSIVSLWDIADMQPVWPNFVVSENRVVNLHADCLDNAITYNMSVDRNICVVIDR